jgi:lysophospholipase L1-like esterase
LPEHRRRASLVGALLVVGCALGTGSREPDVPHWVGTWEAAPQLTETHNLPPAPGLAGATLRQVAHLSLGGAALRLRMSNEFGDAPLSIASVHIARSAGDDRTEASSDVAVLFGGAASISIPAGAVAISDVAQLRVAAGSNLAVSIHSARVPAAVTGHPGSRTTSYLVAGDAVARPALPGAATTDHWYLLSGIDVVAPARSAAVVVLGNSIADGRGSGTNRHNRWPDNLARRLQGDPRTAHVAVLNAGIGGNTVLRGGLGPTAMQRLERDVLSQAGARWVIVSEGVNDIGGARGADSAASVARQLIAAYRDIVQRAHARGLRVYGATILPFGGSFYASADHEAARRRVNDWIRHGGAFDAVIDLDAAMRDAADPSRLRAEVDGGDHLHPNELGYQAIADAIDLGLFASYQRSERKGAAGSPSRL